MILNRGANHGAMQPLSEVTATGSYLVENVSGSEKDRLRLNELGLIVGKPLTIVACANGMRVVRVGECRLALSRETTEAVWVRRTNR